MTIGTALVARMNVRGTVQTGLSSSPRMRLSASSVGNTHSQIMSAGWCLLGGGVRGGCWVFELVDLIVVATPVWLGDQSSQTRLLIERLYGWSAELNQAGSGRFTARSAALS